MIYFSKRITIFPDKEQGEAIRMAPGQSWIRTIVFSNKREERKGNAQSLQSWYRENSGEIVVSVPLNILKEALVIFAFQQQ